MELRLLSVNVAEPRVIGKVNGQPVLSGIAKTPVTDPTIFAGKTGLAGDGQADLSVHGGEDKAVYLYSAEHWSWWETQKHLPCRAGTFGENLTVDGVDETGVAIGDRFRWGDALLEISQPRAPCYKFALHTRRADAPQIMTVSAKCGWYFRLIEEGDAPVNGTLMRTTQSGGITVRDAFVAVMHPKPDPEILRALYDAPALAEAWRAPVAKRLGL